MLEFNYTDFLNEEMSVISTRKLRDAMHDIVMELGPKDTLDVEAMCNILMADYKITISPYFLDKFLDEYMRKKRGEENVKTFFQKSDTKWLRVKEVNGAKVISNNFPYRPPILAKHRKNLILAAAEQRLEDAYKTGMPELNFKEDVIKQTFVLQKPTDSKEMMKSIYNDIIVNNKYENTYDNCWKLMMLMGNYYKLDRIRGYFRLAPQSVKDEYNRGPEGHKKINYELTKPKKKKENVRRDLHDPPDVKRNLSIVDKHLDKYKRWEEFVADTKLIDWINLIDKLETKYVVDSQELDGFLYKMEQLKYILIRYYLVDTKDVLLFYKSVGLVSFIRDWDSSKERPKID